MSHPDQIRARAHELGFDVVGFARADLPLEEEYARYRSFLADGAHGEMTWLAENAAVRARLDTADILEGARSVVCLARRYDRPAGERVDPPFAQGIARYARGRDYHNALRKRARQLATFVRGLGEGVSARPMVDDVPVLERAWAARAGLGFIGKNGLLIVPGRGSYVLLAEIVTTLELEPSTPIPERCGACTRCLDACPTQAFPRPFVLDARRCIAYLTIELRGAIDPALRETIGEHVFGCDVCQEVCPFNRGKRDDAAGAWLAPHARWTEVSLTDVLLADAEAWRSLSSESPLRRATADGMARNAAIVLGNQKAAAAAPALRQVVRDHPSVVVRDAASWALERIEEQ